VTWRDTLDRILCAVGLANRHAAGLSAVFGALFIIYGVQLTYLPVWLDARGLSAKEIALATSAPTFLRIVITPAIAMLADKAEAHRRFVIALAWAALALLAVLARLERGGAIIVLIVLVMIAVQSVMPLLDTITMRVVRREGSITAACGCGDRRHSYWRAMPRASRSPRPGRQRDLAADRRRDADGRLRRRAPGIDGDARRGAKPVA